MNTEKWIVHKFGGTSVGSVESMGLVMKLLNEQKDQKIAVVVSAMSGVTDRLIKAAVAASEQNSLYEELLEGLLAQHTKTALALLNSSDAKVINEILLSEVKDLREILRGVWLSKFLPETTLDIVSGFGELWSSRILAHFWKKYQPDVSWVDARQILVVENGETGPLLQWDICQKNMDEFVKNSKSQHLMITGFVASTTRGVPTTLKRNGSDFSASIFGRLLKSREIVIWTDVDGVYSADPRKVPEAECLQELSYEEAIELAYFGAKVIHPHTMGPAVELNIPILIKNTFNPAAPGTYIHRVVNPNNDRIARGFTIVDNLSLMNVEGTGMIGVPGVAQRLFGALREVGVSVILISQASSEHSICFVVPSIQESKARDALNKVFSSEIKYGQIERIDSIPNCSVLAMVGDSMVEKSGVAGRFLSALGTAGVSVRAIAQGSSERNISVVIDGINGLRALRATHSAFFLSRYTLSLGIIGPGQIGKEFIKQLETQQSSLKTRFNLDVRVRGIADSKKMRLDEKQILKGNESSHNSVMESWEENSETLNYEKFIGHIQCDSIPHSVIIDCTSSEKVADLYSNCLNKGISIITPNKKAGSGSLQRYQEIRTLEGQGKAHFYGEATVGAGLPLVSTLKDLLQTGDEIISIEGILSGTLSYLFSELKVWGKFSDIVLSAKQKGYTEPDPRDDLNGLDMARKLVILARESGFRLSLEDVSIESLVPKNLDAPVKLDEFISRLPELDNALTERLRKAEDNGYILRYTGFLDRTGKAKVGLREFPKTHPFAGVSGTDNIIIFRTKRYDQQPLIIQGPGAGPEVTASGIFADLLRLARSLGVPS